MDEQPRNLRHDDTVHAREDNGFPTCGTSLIPACAPEITSDDVTCIWCLSIIG